LWALFSVVTDRGSATALRQLRDIGVVVQAGNLASVSYGEALLAARRGENVTARRLLADADEALDGMPGWRHLLHLVLARSVAGLGIADVEAWLRHALAFLEPRGEVRMARSCRELMRRLGFSVPRQRAGSDDVPVSLRALGITGREYDVLRLIAQRLSNPEIAQRLYLSPRTVETHVSNLLAKAGASSRSGLAVLVESGSDKDL
jgi:DNA-binding CsgD family transcriptional regulator